MQALLSDDELLALISETQTPANIVVLPPAAETPTSAKPKLNFGGIEEKKPAETTRTEYPVLADPDGKIALQVEAFLEAHAKEEAAKGAKEAARLELVKVAKPFHFTTNAGRRDVPSSVSIVSKKGEVLVAFKDAYKKLDEKKFEKVVAVMGQPLADKYLELTFEFTIKSEKIPVNKMQSVIDAVRLMAQRLAVEDAVSVAKCYKPTPDWHITRYSVLDAKQNLALEDAVDKEKGFCTMAVSPARGRK